MQTESRLANLELEVAVEDVGRVIGRSGAYIKQIRETSGCSISVVDHPRNPAVRVLRIRGAGPSLDIARQMVEDVAGGGKICFLRDLNETAVFALTAKGWLANEARLHNVTFDVKQRTIKLVGSSEESVQEFRELCRRHVADMMESAAETVEGVPGEAVERLMNSPSLKSLENAHFLKIEMTKSSDRSLKLTFRGPKITVMEAVTVCRAMLGGSARVTIPLYPGLLSSMSDQKWKDLQADLTEAVEQECNVRVTVESGAVIIEGSSDENVASGRTETEHVFQYYFGDNCATIYVNPLATDAILGPDLSFILRMQSPELCVDFTSETSTVWLCGSAAAADRAYRRITSKIAEWRCLNEIITLPNSRLARIVSGPRGETVRRIENSTGAEIVVTEFPDGTPVVHVHGRSPEIVQRATAAVETVIEMARDKKKTSGGNAGVGKQF